MEQYKGSIFIDQDAFWQELYAVRRGNPDFRKELAFYCNSDSYYAKLLGEDRIRLIPDMYNWSKFLQKSGFDYSFGSRIHGTIMAILSGIPATIVAIDSRTQEMAEFFDIPLVKYERTMCIRRKNCMRFMNWQIILDLMKHIVRNTKHTRIFYYSTALFHISISSIHFLITAENILRRHKRSTYSTFGKCLSE